MKCRALASLVVLSLLSVAAAQSAAPAKQSFSPPSRTFRFTYSFTVKNIPTGAKLVRIWVPVAHSDEHQTVRLVSVKAPVQTTMSEDPEYGNQILYAEIRNPAQATADFTVEYEVTRREYARGDYAQLETKDTKPGVVPVTMQRYVAPDRLIPTTGEIKQLAAQVTANQAPSPKPRLPTITCSKPCATTRPAPAGDAAMPSGPAIPSTATAPTSTPSLSA